MGLIIFLSCVSFVALCLGIWGIGQLNDTPKHKQTPKAHNTESIPVGFPVPELLKEFHVSRLLEFRNGHFRNGCFATAKIAHFCEKQAISHRIVTAFSFNPCDSMGRAAKPSNFL